MAETGEELTGLEEITSPTGAEQANIQNSTGKWYRTSFQTIVDFIGGFFVSLTGAQSISGIKNFLAKITVLDPVAGNEPETKGRIDAVKGAGWTNETVKGNADGVASNAAAITPLNTKTNRISADGLEYTPDLINPGAGYINITETYINAGNRAVFNIPDPLDRGDAINTRVTGKVYPVLFDNDLFVPVETGVEIKEAIEAVMDDNVVIQLPSSTLGQWDLEGETIDFSGVTNCVLEIANGGKISNGTIAGNPEIIPKPYQIFGENVVFSGSPKFEFVTPEMWGAVSDGVTDDSLAIMSALQFNKVRIERGNYLIGSECEIKSNTDIYLDSNASITYSPNATATRLLFAENKSNIKLHGKGKIDGGIDVYGGAERVNISFKDCTNISVEDIEITRCTYVSDGANPDNLCISALWFSNCIYTTVDNVYAHDNNNVGIQFSGGVKTNPPIASSNYNRIVNCSVVGNKVSGIDTNRATNYIIIGANALSGNGIALPSEGKVANNQLTVNAAYNIIIGNIVTDNLETSESSNSGINIGHVYDVANNSQAPYTIVSNNIIVGSKFGIYPTSSDKITISGNNISRCQEEGIRVDTCNDVLITNNNIYDCNLSLASKPIITITDSNNSVISNNYIDMKENLLGITILGSLNTNIVSNNFNYNGLSSVNSYAVRVLYLNDFICANTTINSNTFIGTYKYIVFHDEAEDITDVWASDNMAPDCLYFSRSNRFKMQGNSVVNGVKKNFPLSLVEPTAGSFQAGLSYYEDGTSYIVRCSLSGVYDDIRGTTISITTGSADVIANSVDGLTIGDRITIDYPTSTTYEREIVNIVGTTITLDSSTSLTTASDVPIRIMQSTATTTLNSATITNIDSSLFKEGDRIAVSYNGGALLLQKRIDFIIDSSTITTTTGTSMQDATDVGIYFVPPIWEKYSTVPISSTTANRPIAVAVGFPMFDTDLGYSISYNGTDWVDGSGVIV